MTASRVLRQTDRSGTTWANGGGITYEVMASPAGAGLRDFDWRVSFADVASEGPFSYFAGVDRVLVLAEGHGMELRIDGELHMVRAGEPIAFPGEAQVECRLPLGATSDLNVMTRRGRCHATVDVIVVHDECTFPSPTATELLAVLDGSCALAGDAGARLAFRDCLLLGEPVRLLGRATLAHIRITAA